MQSHRWWITDLDSLLNRGDKPIFARGGVMYLDCPNIRPPPPPQRVLLPPPPEREKRGLNAKYLSLTFIIITFFDVFTWTPCMVNAILDKDGAYYLCMIDRWSVHRDCPPRRISPTLNIKICLHLWIKVIWVAQSFFRGSNPGLEKSRNRNQITSKIKLFSHG
mgnify:CR=1 FL=1